MEMKFMTINKACMYIAYESFMLPKRVGRADETGAALCEGLICSMSFFVTFLDKQKSKKIHKKNRTNYFVLEALVS